MNISRLTTTFAAALCCALLQMPASAEQFQRIGSYEVHYIVLPTMSLKPEIAAQYGVNRSDTLSLLNVSVLESGTQPTAVELEGRSANLLGQMQQLEFSEVREGPAIYYLSLVRHSDEEMHRLQVDLTFPDGTSGTLRWEQKLYVER